MNEPHATKLVSEMTDSELQRLIAEMRGYPSLDEIKQEADRQYPNGYSILYQIPNWPQDTHAAVVDLLAEMEGYNLRWSIAHHGWWVGNYNLQQARHHDHPARAICAAWVLWKRGQA